jgi:NADH:ubiquinone oxidoreductase subunit E
MGRMCTTCKKETPSDLVPIFSKYPGNESDLIPLLQDIQALQGYISSDAMAQTSAFLNVPESTIYGVVTFYAQFYLSAQGENKVKICMGTACHVRGAGEILSAVERKLGISAGQTTPDMKFTLERVACFGSCALAPVVVVNDKVYGNVTPEKALEILEGIQ